MNTHPMTMYVTLIELAAENLEMTENSTAGRVTEVNNKVVSLNRYSIFYKESIYT